MLPSLVCYVVFYWSTGRCVVKFLSGNYKEPTVLNFFSEISDNVMYSFRLLVVRGVTLVLAAYSFRVLVIYIYIERERERLFVCFFVFFFFLSWLGEENIFVGFGLWSHIGGSCILPKNKSMGLL